ncbi:type III secretion system needle complex protein PrgI [Salmonella enterica subsp. enterica]|nr:type III secretion system needle complex protein PrgI [Salmonella enterica subsp. enterica]
MPTSWSGYLDEVSAKFDKGVDDLQTQVTEALDKLAAKTLRSGATGGVSE